MIDKIKTNTNFFSKDNLLVYLDNLYSKIKDERLNDPKVISEILEKMEDACKVTNLSFPDLLQRLDFKPKDLTIEALEAFLAELRSIFWLQHFGFTSIIPLKAKKKISQPDFTAKYNSKIVAIEVFCLIQKHGQQKDPFYDVYKNFDPNFTGSKFGRDFISVANNKKVQLDSVRAGIKILLCVLNSKSMINLNSKNDFDSYLKLLYRKLNLSEQKNYYLGLLTGRPNSSGILDDIIYPKLK
ncbi:hypothetical protein KAS79_01020 [Candidatus Parcubacteria bacterium]|nr:hypothetical protein [Candidatus Parcubacteria bacterium]